MNPKQGHDKVAIRRAHRILRDALLAVRVESPEPRTGRNILRSRQRLAAFKDAPVRYAGLTGCDGRMVRMGNLALITVRESIERLGQRRFVVAHELGHVLLHPDLKQIDEVDRRQARNFDYFQAAEELEANYFAAELLMPKRFFAVDVNDTEPGWKTIQALADRYQTTLAATAAQYVHYSEEACFLIASEGGEWKWFVVGERTEGFYSPKHGACTNTPALTNSSRRGISGAGQHSADRRIHNPTKITMNNGTSEGPTTARNPRPTTDELDTLKRELMKAEVRLAKARATVVSAEIDIKVLNSRLRAYAK